jgi:hypothetical protein
VGRFFPETARTEEDPSLSSISCHRKGKTMKTRTFAQRTGLAVLAAGLAVCLLSVPARTKEAVTKEKAPAQTSAYKISGPYTHENLTIFLVHGDDQLKGKTFLTLEEALEQKKVIVHETKNVNRLEVENVSDTEIYIQSGEIVKGGQQDRTIAFDLILPRKSGKVGVTSFCVEQGRWTKRGKEAVAKFEAAPNALPSKDAKIAVKSAGRETNATVTRPNAPNQAPRQQAARSGIPAAQAAVWNEVSRKQMLLSRALGKSVQSEKSKSSLQLTLEDKKLLETVDGFTKKLKGLLEGKKDVIGYAFAINGQINSADIYGSSDLFKKLWPKLLAATVVEAISEKQKDKKFEHPKAETITAFMKEAETGKAEKNDVTRRVRMVTQETKKNYFFETQDLANKAAPVHKNYIKK